MAQTAPAKKMIMVNILDILKRYTDAEHTLSQKQIVDYLWSDYNMAADRKTVARNLTNLMEAYESIQCKDDVARTYINKKGEKETSYILSDFYLERDFTDAELRLLIDSLLFSKYIPHKQCQELVTKLEGLSNKYFSAHVKHVHALPETASPNKQLFLTIEILDEAIEKGLQVAFNYNTYETDKKMHPKENPDGSVREFVVNPYQMAATNGRYYLICNYEGKPNIANCRLDRITNIRLLDKPAKPKEQVQGGKQFSLPQHMAEHLYMFSGESVPVTFRMKKDIVKDVIDWFGMDVIFSDETDDEVTARVTVNWHAMRHWALQYCRHVTVLSPPDLAEHVQQDLADTLERYKNCED